MGNKDKILERLEKAPQNVRYSEIETLFQNKDFTIREGKGSHKKIIYKKDATKFVSFALHNNDCKTPYKKHLRELDKFYLLNK